MLKRFWQAYTSSDSETMALTLVLWLCLLPVIGLVVAPWMGASVAGLVAVALLLAMAAICWAICLRQRWEQTRR